MHTRLIPILLLHAYRRLVKTVGFGLRTYIDNPFNVLCLFNEREADELFISDIDTTTCGGVVAPGFIVALSSECYIPLAYEGGLENLLTCEALNRAGVEKFAIGVVAPRHSYLGLSAVLGAQVVVGCMDVWGVSDRALLIQLGWVSTRKGPDACVHSVEVAGVAGVPPDFVPALTVSASAVASGNACSFITLLSAVLIPYPDLDDIVAAQAANGMAA